MSTEEKQTAAGYQPLVIEPKWQKYWDEHKTFKTKEDADAPKFYALDMFPYPSGNGLHVGHWRAATMFFTLWDGMHSVCRQSSMRLTQGSILVSSRR